MADTKPPTLVELAEEILEAAKKLQEGILKPPTFFEDTLADLPADLEVIRRGLVDATSTLNALSRGAGSFTYGRIVQTCFYYPAESLCMRAVYHFRIPHVVPLGGSISFKDIAKAVNADEGLITRLIRHAIGFYIFYEPEAGRVAHTLDSRLLVEDPYLFDFVGCMAEDIQSGYQKVIQAMERWPGSEEPNHSGCSLAWGTDLTFYDFLSQNPEQFRRFSGMLTYVARGEIAHKKEMLSLYPWKDFPKYAVLVDVGGGNGQVSLNIAPAHPTLRFIVQDLAGAFKDGEKSVPAELKNRVSFMVHNFKEPQPVKHADIYLFCQVIHNWSDKYVVHMMGQLVPALKNGSRVLIIDRCMPEENSLRGVETRELRTVDLVVCAMCNSRDRSVAEIRQIFKRADPRFKFLATYRAQGSPYMVCEHVWIPSNGDAEPG